MVDEDFLDDLLDDISHDKSAGSNASSQFKYEIPNKAVGQQN